MGFSVIATSLTKVYQAIFSMEASFILWNGAPVTTPSLRSIAFYAQNVTTNACTPVLDSALTVLILVSAITLHCWTKFV